MTEPTRAWLYRVALAIIALAGIYGVVDESQTAGIVAVVTALLSSGLAVRNTSTARPIERDRHDIGESALMTLVLVAGLIVLVIVIFRMLAP